MASNLYKVGDWVYCEVSPYQPYVIRRIEELTKTPNGNVEAKVICAFRRRDISSSLLATIEKHSKKEKENDSTTDTNSDSDMSMNVTSIAASNNSNMITINGNSKDFGENDLTDLQKYQLKHRELFYSKYTDTIAVTTIRAKCCVLLFCSDVEKYQDYLGHDDLFYYHLTYDPYQRTVVADRGEIRVGLKYQAEIPQLSSVPIDQYNVNLSKFEELKWQQNNNLSEREIEQFLTISKSVGTFARALDCNNAFKQPSLPLSAAAASRDVTLFHAMNTLHEHNYNIGKAALSLVTSIGPIICKDEMEDWSAAEANLFEDALDKYGKDFNEIRKDFLPWKSLKSIIEYYYAWKTTDRYVQQKRIKSSEQESKLKQVYIPNHTKQNQTALLKSSQIQLLQQNDIQFKACESCGIAQTQQWYLYNPLPIVLQLLNAQQQIPQPQLQQGNNQGRLCSDCWTYWKKHAAFKYQNARSDRLNQSKTQIHKCIFTGCNKEFKAKQLLTKHCATAHGLHIRGGSPKPILRNRSSFYLLTTPQTQASRFVCPCLYKLKKYARRPSRLIDFAEVTKEWEKDRRNIKLILNNHKKNLNKYLNKKINKDLLKNLYKVSKLKSFKNTNDADLDTDYEQLEINTNGPEYLQYFQKKCLTPVYVPEKLLYPKPSQEFLTKYHMSLISQNKKRGHDQNDNASSNDTSPSSKRCLLARQSHGYLKSQSKSSSKSIKPPIQSIHLSNAPDDLYYQITKKLKLIRNEFDMQHLKKLARSPFKLLKQYQSQYAVVSKISLQSLNASQKQRQQQNYEKLQNGVDLSKTSSNTDNKINEDEAKLNGVNGEIVVLD